MYEEELNFSKRPNSKLDSSILCSQTFQLSNAIEVNKNSKERLISLKNSKLELLTITCALIASKVHEIDDKLIRIFELEKFMKYKYTYNNITHCEAKILDEINWNLVIQTPYHYINLYISAGVLFTDDIIVRSYLSIQITLILNYANFKYFFKE